METWRDITGFEGLYQVSDLGRVKRLVSFKRKTERVLRPGTMGGRYHFVVLSKEAVHTCKTIHKLVAEAFIGPCPPKHDVNHKNYERFDNRPDNLEYVTRAANLAHSRLRPGAHERPFQIKGTEVPNALLNEKKVREIRRRSAAGESNPTIARAMGLGRHCVYAVVSGKNWSWLK